MGFKDASKFDHDHDGQAGGSLRHMKPNEKIEDGKAGVKSPADAPKNTESPFSDGSNPGAGKPGGDAMVTTPPGLTQEAPRIDEPVTRGAVTTSGSGDDPRTAGERAAQENAETAAERGEAVLHDPETGKPIEVHDDIEGKAAKLESRDERHDSIDRHTGALTEEAVALRAEHGVTGTGLQVGDKPAEAEADAKD